MTFSALRSAACIRTHPKAFQALSAKRPQRRLATMASSSAADWAQQDTRRMLHAVYRVGNLDETLEYYKKHFGLKQLRYRDIPEEKYTNAFLGSGDERTNFALELTYNYGKDSYDLGSGFGHFALAVPDVYKTVESIKSAGGKVSRDAGPVKGGTTQIAFVDDPTGYKWELIQRSGPIPEPIAQVMLRVTDLDASIKYYTEALGCKLLRKKDNPEYKYTLAFLGYGPEDESTVFELTYNWCARPEARMLSGDKPFRLQGCPEARMLSRDKKSYDNMLGNAYAQVAISTTDVYKTADAIRAAGGKITREPGPLPGLGTKILATTDPDGWKVVFVDNEDFLAELK